MPSLTKKLKKFDELKNELYLSSVKSAPDLEKKFQALADAMVDCIDSMRFLAAKEFCENFSNYTKEIFDDLERGIKQYNSMNPDDPNCGAKDSSYLTRNYFLRLTYFDIFLETAFLILKKHQDQKTSEVYQAFVTKIAMDVLSYIIKNAVYINGSLTKEKSASEMVSLMNIVINIFVKLDSHISSLKIHCSESFLNIKTLLFTFCSASVQMQLDRENYKNAYEALNNFEKVLTFYIVKKQDKDPANLLAVTSWCTQRDIVAEHITLVENEIARISARTVVVVSSASDLPVEQPNVIIHEQSAQQSVLTASADPQSCVGSSASATENTDVLSNVAASTKKDVNETVLSKEQKRNAKKKNRRAKQAALVSLTVSLNTEKNPDLVNDETSTEHKSIDFTSQLIEITQEQKEVVYESRSSEKDSVISVETLTSLESKACEVDTALGFMPPLPSQDHCITTVTAISSIDNCLLAPISSAVNEFQFPLLDPLKLAVITKFSTYIQAQTQIEAYGFGGIMFKRYTRDIDILLNSRNGTLEEIFEFIKQLPKEEFHVLKSYPKRKGDFLYTSIKVICQGVEIDCICSATTPKEHRKMLDFKNGAHYYDFRTKAMAFLDPDFPYDPNNNVLCMVKNTRDTLLHEPSILLRLVRILAKEALSLEPEALRIIKEEFLVLNPFVITPENSRGKFFNEKNFPDKLYSELLLLFCDGWAVRNLHVITGLNLFEKLFSGIRLLTVAERALTLNLVYEVAKYNDYCVENHLPTVPPSLFFYAAYWYVFIKAESINRINSLYPDSHASICPAINLQKGEYPKLNLDVDYSNRNFLACLEHACHYGSVKPHYVLYPVAVEPKSYRY